MFRLMVVALRSPAATRVWIDDPRLTSSTSWGSTPPLDIRLPVGHRTCPIEPIETFSFRTLASGAVNPERFVVYGWLGYAM